MAKKLSELLGLNDTSLDVEHATEDELLKYRFYMLTDDEMQRILKRIDELEKMKSKDQALFLIKQNLRNVDLPRR